MHLVTYILYTHTPSHSPMPVRPGVIWPAIRGHSLLSLDAWEEGNTHPQGQLEGGREERQEGEIGRQEGQEGEIGREKGKEGDIGREEGQEGEIGRQEGQEGEIGREEGKEGDIGREGKGGDSLCKSRVPSLMILHYMYTSRTMLFEVSTGYSLWLGVSC